MKTLKNSLLLFASFFGLLLATSCSSKPDSVDVIPQDAKFVASFDVLSLIKKGELNNLSQYDFYKTVKKEIRNENKQVSRIFDDVMEDPTITGLKFTSDIFLYYVGDKSTEQFFCVSADLSDEADFAEFAENLLKKSDIEFSKEKGKNFNYFIADNDEFAIGYDSDKVVLVTASSYSSRENIESQVEDLFSLKADDCIAKNDDFNSFYKDKKDINFWISTNSFIDQYYFEQIQKNSAYDLADCAYGAYLNFDDDNISLQGRFFPNEEIQKLMDKYDIWDNSFNNDLLTYFPKDQLLTASASFDPKAYYNIMKEQDEFEKMDSECKKETDLTLQQVFESFGGNVVFSLFNVANKEYSYMGVGYEVDESQAVLMDERYGIQEFGELTEQDKKLLNEGKTIPVLEYGSYDAYSINIRNILAEGKDADYAIQNESEVNWLEGGWVPVEKEMTDKQLLPYMSLAFDLENTKVIEKFLSKIPKGKVTKKDFYYEFLVGNKYPAYFAYNDKTVLITNDLESIKAFKNKGFSKNNLKDSDISSDISKSKFFAFGNLDYKNYPKDLKTLIEERQSERETGIFNKVTKFVKSLVIKQVDDYTSEFVLNLQNTEDNSLKALLKLIDDGYKSYTSGFDNDYTYDEEAPEVSEGTYPVEEATPAAATVEEAAVEEVYTE